MEQLHLYEFNVYVFNSKSLSDTLCVCVAVVFIVALSVILTKGVESGLAGTWWMILIICILVLLLLTAVVIIWRQPQSSTKAAFMVRI